MMLLWFFLAVVGYATTVDKTVALTPGTYYEIKTELEEFYLSYDIEVTNGDGSVADVILLPSSEISNYANGEKFMEYPDYSVLAITHATQSESLVSVSLDDVPTSLIIVPKNLVETETVVIKATIESPPNYTGGIVAAILVTAGCLICCCAGCFFCGYMLRRRQTTIVNVTEAGARARTETYMNVSDDNKTTA